MRNITFKELRNYLSVTDRLSICMMEYAVSGKQEELVLVNCMEIRLSQEPKSFL